jgi:hypothetical protein
MEQIEIRRTGLPPIRFTGEQIGKGSTRSIRGEGQNRWTEVSIYHTQGGRYVAHVGRITCWQGETDHHAAVSKATPQEVVAWLKGEDDKLGRASQEAVEMAAKNDPAFAEAWVEAVE